MTHKTSTMEKVKELRVGARKNLKTLQAMAVLQDQEELAGVDIPALREKLLSQAEDQAAKAQELKNSGQARLEDLDVFQVEKISKKGKPHLYWHATWKHGRRSHNAYLGSCKKMDRKAALQKARMLKSQDLKNLRIDIAPEI